MLTEQALSIYDFLHNKSFRFIKNPKLLDYFERRERKSIACFYSTVNLRSAYVSLCLLSSTMFCDSIADTAQKNYELFCKFIPRNFSPNVKKSEGTRNIFFNTRGEILVSPSSHEFYIFII